jgi:hypothetical protein
MDCMKSPMDMGDLEKQATKRMSSSLERRLEQRGGSLVAGMKRDQSWRARLTRDIGWSLLVKAGLLTLLWALFFSGAQRCRVDGPAIASRLALEGHKAETQGQFTAEGGDRCD